MGDAQVIDEILAFVAGYRRAFEEGDQWAVRRVVDRLGGDGTFEAMPFQVREAMKAGTAQNICQWETNFAFRPSIQDYKSLQVPTTLVRGGKTHPNNRFISQRLHQLIPTSTLVEIPDASHFIIHTHPLRVCKHHGPKAGR